MRWTNRLGAALVGEGVFLSDLPSTPGDLRMGRVLSRSPAVLLGDFPKFFAVTLVIWLPYPLVLRLIEPTFTAFARDPQHLTLDAALTVLIYEFAFIALLLLLLLAALRPAVILCGAFQRMRGRSFAVAESGAQGLSRFLPILGMLVVLLLAFSGAALLLIIPAFI